MKKYFSQLIIAVFLSVFLFGYIGLLPTEAAGATLFIAPSTGTYNLGKSFTVDVKVNSGGGVGINAAEGLIKFDSGKLSVSSLSEAGSIFTLWTQNPTYSNGDGTISFGGGSPGAYTGASGKIFSVTFSPKQIGETQVNFTSGSVLAADGKGTNVFSGYGQAKYTINKKTSEPKKEPIKRQEKPKEEKSKGLLPPIPEIDSSTYPKDDVWYSNNVPEFSWKVLPDLSGVSFSIDDIADSDPGNSSDGIIESEKFPPQKDGVWYFHIKYQNRSGWGLSGHKKFMVDATPPEAFDLKVDNGGDSTNPSPKLVFSTKDKTSGIKQYKLINGTESTVISADKVSSGYYQLDPLSPGEYTISLLAIDKAGNTASSSATFIVNPLKAPIITSIPKIINKKDDLIIRGTSFYPQVTVKIYLTQGSEKPIEATVKTDDEGNWSYFHKEKLAKGSYEIWAKIIDQRGAQSLESTRHLMTVVSPSLVDAYGLWIIILLLIIIILLSAYIWYQRQKYMAEKIRIKIETDEVKVKLSKIFYALREELDELIVMADKKPGLSEAERRVKEKLQESLDISEEFINKEVEDVEKEIKLPKKISDK